MAVIVHHPLAGDAFDECLVRHIRVTLEPLDVARRLETGHNRRRQLTGEQDRGLHQVQTCKVQSAK